MNDGLIEDIKQIACDVYDELGSGHSEVVYERAMHVGLRLAGIHYEPQKVIELTYKNHYVGEGYTDIVVRQPPNKVVVELKAIHGDLGAPEVQQLKNYLKILKIEVGILINFPQPGRNKTKTSSKNKPDFQLVP